MSCYAISCHIHSITHSFKHVLGTCTFARHYTTPCIERTEEERVEFQRLKKTHGQQVIRLQRDSVFISIVVSLT